MRRSRFRTQAPGTFAKTVAGIDELVARASSCGSTSSSARQSADFADFVDFVAARWPRATAIVLVRRSVDRPGAARPRHDPAVHRRDAGPRRRDPAARRLGIAPARLESMCGVPLCLVPDDLAEFLPCRRSCPESTGVNSAKPKSARIARSIAVASGYGEATQICTAWVSSCPSPEGVPDRGPSHPHRIEGGLGGGGSDDGPTGPRPARWLAPRRSAS